MADVYKPHISGITNYIALNKDYLEKQGYEVFVFTFGDLGFTDHEPRVIRSPGLPISDTGYTFSLNHSLAARRLILTMDIVHVHHPFLSGTLALLYCKPRRIPIIFTNHTRYDLYARVYLPALPEIIGEAALEAFMPAFCRACDLVISPSSGMREVLVNMGVQSPVDIVPNGVDLAPYRENIIPFERAQLGFTEEDIVLIYTGRLGPEKNLSFLLRSFAGVARAYPGVKLLLVGDGPEKENLQAEIMAFGVEGCVHIVGMVLFSEVKRYLATADAFVTASVTEVHPLSVIEAMAMGLPVLGIRSPGIADTVEDGISGLLVQEEEMAAFTAMMVRIATDDAGRLEMGKQARVIAEKYAIEKTAQQMIERYEKVIQISARQRRSFRTRLTRLLDHWR